MVTLIGYRKISRLKVSVAGRHWPNRGRHRLLPEEQEVRVHRSVIYRMQQKQTVGMPRGFRWEAADLELLMANADDDGTIGPITSQGVLAGDMRSH